MVLVLSTKHTTLVQIVNKSQKKPLYTDKSTKLGDFFRKQKLSIKNGFLYTKRGRCLNLQTSPSVYNKSFYQL